MESDFDEEEQVLIPNTEQNDDNSKLPASKIVRDLEQIHSSFQCRLIIISMIVLNIFSIIISSLLLYEHYYSTSNNSICDISRIWSCSDVNTSSFSELFSIPVALLGIIYSILYLFFLYVIYILYTNIVAAYYIFTLLLYSLLGFFFIVYFIICEFILHKFCIFCTMVHVITFLLLILSFLLYKLTISKSNFVSLSFAFFSSLFYRLQFLIYVCIAFFMVLLFIFNFISVFSLIPNNKTEYNPSAVSIDKFSSCLISHNITFYGTNWCGHCAAQKEILKHTSYLEKGLFVDCGDKKNELKCSKVKAYPTWIRKYSNSNSLYSNNASPIAIQIKEGLMTLTELEKFSSCVVFEPTLKKT